MSHIHRKPVDSSFISAIGHDPETDTLHVEMNNGNVYTYPGVSPEEHESLVNAPSVGAHFSKHIRPVYSGTLLK